VCFITLEDESGLITLVIWPDLMEKLRKVIMSAQLMEVRGRIEYDDEVTHVIVTNIVDASAKLMTLSQDHLVPAIARADEVNRPLPHSNRSPQISELPPVRHGHPRDARIIPNSRDFH
jgi:error-prone DNA polymerase